jgi:hypothetical protein
MASFDKFIKDLERRKQNKINKNKIMQKRYEDDLFRKKVDLYSEKWQNSVRYSKVNKRGTKK